MYATTEIRCVSLPGMTSVETLYLAGSVNYTILELFPPKARTARTHARTSYYVAFSIARWVVSDVLRSVRLHLVYFIIINRATARSRTRYARARDYPTRVTDLTGHAFTMAFSIVYCCLRHTIRDRLPGPPTPDHITHDSCGDICPVHV